MAQAWQHAARADRPGHLMHLGLLVFWGLSVAIGYPAWLKDVGLGAIAVWALMRLCFGGIKYAWDSWTQSPLMWLILAWLLWPLITLSWSAQPIWGLDHWWGLRVLLAPLLLWPVLQWWRWAEAGFIVGGLIICLVVLLQCTDFLHAINPNRPSAGMKAWTCGLITAITGISLLTRSITTKHLYSSICWLLLSVLPLLTLLANATKSAQLGFLGAVLVMCTVICMHCRCLIRRMVIVIGLCSVSLLVITSVDLLLLHGQLSSQISHRYIALNSELQRSPEQWASIPINKDSTTLRTAMWGAAAHEWATRPLTGWGYGGLAEALHAYPGIAMHKHAIKGIAIDETPMDPHSTWIFILASCGLFGLGIVITTLTMAMFHLVQGAKSDPTNLTMLGGLACWCTVSTFESTVLSGSGIAILSMFFVAALAAAQLRDESKLSGEKGQTVIAKLSLADKQPE